MPLLTRVTRARFVAVMLAVVLVFVLVLARPAPAAPNRAAPDALDPPPNRAALVVQFGDGTLASECVAFAEEQVSGAALLTRSQFAVAVVEDNLGAFVCQIEDEGCPADDCLCALPLSWAYWLGSSTAPGTWQFAPVGASTRVVRDGAVDGWVWGDGAPPALSFADVCVSPRVYLPLVVSYTQ